MNKSTIVLSLSLALLPVSIWAHEPSAHQHHSMPTVEERHQYPWGMSGKSEQVARTIELRMSDLMRFDPDHVVVRKGETIRFVYHNEGVVMHEFVLGSKEELHAHAEMMAADPNMAHAEPYMVHVAPGEKAELIWTFNRAGAFDFACLIAGHYQAGMTGTVEVQEN